jgi:hypothetical protein
MDETQEKEIELAFKRGQEAWRQKKRIYENPYPLDAKHHHAAWADGWKSEAESQPKSSDSF